LPVGLQIVGPPRADARVLAGAKALEEILDLQESVPIDPREENAANPRHQVYSR
jgi:amidase